jgi:hypothetical protein
VDVAVTAEDAPSAERSSEYPGPGICFCVWMLRGLETFEEVEPAAT